MGISILGTSPPSYSTRIVAVAAERGSPKDLIRKKIFVAGSSGNTGRIIVQKLLSLGFEVRAGVTDVNRATQLLPSHPKLQIVRADVEEGPEKLSEALCDSDVVICATGFRRSMDLFAPWKVDNLGTVNLVEACRILNPAYIFLNLFGLTLIAKLQAEQHIKRSGINYTIIRPGGLTNDPPTGNVIMEAEDTLYDGSISRDQVAEVAVEAMLNPEASSYKVVEVVSSTNAPKYSLKDLFNEI